MDLKAFVSCSRLPEDKQVIDYFRHFIGAFQITPELHEYKDVRQDLGPAIENHINRCDCFIGIVTCGPKIADSEEHMCSEWITQEIAFALVSRKPTVLFVEKGVRVAGLTRDQYQFERFDRNQLCDAVDKHAAFLFNLRQALDATNPLNATKSIQYVRHSVEIGDTLASDQFVQIVEVEMESLVEGLAAVHHSVFLDHPRVPGLSVRARHFSFESVKLPPNVAVTSKKFIESDERYVWTIHFDPPLKQGERVTYRYKTVRGYDQPYTLQGVLEAMDQGRYRFLEPVCKACGWVIGVPTQLLSYSIDFPEGYDIKEPHIDVTFGEALFGAEDENKRIRHNHWFHMEKRFEQWRIRFTVPHPQFGCTYNVAYTPPSSSKLDQA